MSISPVSSIAPSLPIVDSPTLDGEWNDNAEENWDGEETTGSATAVPLALALGTTVTTTEIVHLPTKGITAWLAHMNRTQRRQSILEKLRSLVF